MKELLRAAVQQQLRLAIYYEPGARVIEPHAVGYGADGQLLLRAYQTEGASASGEHAHWKLLRGDRIHSCRLEGSSFDEPREGYREGDKAMKGGIIAQVQLRNRTFQA